MDPAQTRQTLVGVAARRGADRDLSGVTLAGRYDVLELLGAGGMGAVYRAHDRELDEMVALKVIRGETRAGMLDQFRHEVKLARRVTHVNIARTFELVTTDGMVFCTMELVEGESLRKRLVREGAMSVADAVAIASGLCDGLAVAHAAGVIHRDIKPENVLLTHTGRVVLADFGVAALGAAETDGSLSGTLEYMAPEQARGEQATPASDVYAVGIVLYEMLCGLRAFAGTMSELIVAKQDVERVSLDVVEALARESIPAELREIVGKATAREPAARIATALELARRLAPWRGAHAEPIREAPRVEPELATVIVLAPRGDSPRKHVAAGIHQELLRRLASTPRLRLRPRVDPVALAGATTVELAVGEWLDVTVRRDALSSVLRCSLDIASVDLVAQAIASAVIELAGHGADPDATARLELLLQTRVHLHAGFSGIRPAHALLERGIEQWPDDPRIASELAVLILKFSYMEGLDVEQAMVRQLVDSALARGPELAESHVAAAQLELHDGDPAIAAREFRKAIALSPYQAEPHDGLGRMLLEAGYVDDAMPRLEQALAISPKLSSLRWEIARAHALEGNWGVHERLVAQLRAEGNDRPIARFRYGLWRGNRAEMIEAREVWRVYADRLSPTMMEQMFACAIDGEWTRYRGELLHLETDARQSKRRHAFLAQVAAEVAGYCGDVEMTLLMLQRANRFGCFDRHWFDRCPTIAAARATAEGAQVCAIVTERAHAILDALYGEGVADTIAAG